MAMLDLNLQFSNAQAITSTAASYVYDMETGLMLTGTTFTPSPNANIGNVTYFGEDLGIGSGVGTPRFNAVVGTAFAAAGAATLQIAFQTAPMNSTAFGSGLLSDLTFATALETDVIAKATLTAGAHVLSMDWPKRAVGQSMPRFVRFNYIVATGPFTAGTITTDVTLGGVDTVSIGQYGRNFTVGA